MTKIRIAIDPIASRLMLGASGDIFVYHLLFLAHSRWPTLSSPNRLILEGEIPDTDLGYFISIFSRQIGVREASYTLANGTEVRI